MEVTPNEFLPYPTNNDPGNGALDLQVLAEAIDAATQGKLAHFRQIINRPARVRQLSANTGNMIPNINNDISIIGGAFWLPATYNSTGPVLGSNPYSSLGLGTTPGIYRAGACVISNPIGAVTAGSSRILEIDAIIPSDPSNFPVSTVTRKAFSITFETSTGSQYQTTELEFLTNFPGNNSSTFAGTQIAAFFNHQNAASNMQLLAGSTMWIYRVGDVEG